MTTPESGTTQIAPTRTGTLLAPLWHTAVILVLLLGISLVNALTRHLVATPAHTHYVMYGVTLVWEWVLLALVHWGLLMRRTPLRQLLGIRRTGAAEFWTDVAIGIGFWFASLFALGMVGVLLRAVRMHPEKIRSIVSRMAPASLPELTLWFALSISAGFCEELIFRGYLQQQFTALTRRIWVGIAISAVFFGLSHGYEGASGILLITLYGVFFGILAHLRRSLRPGIIAHAWHDSLSGVVLYFGSQWLHRIPH
ncbi:MAG TPA: CPBP family intramembrane glutamic endopeptidase [Acidobacteriaceae bacterium]